MKKESAKNSLDFAKESIIPTIIVIIIATSGFVAGYFQNQYNDQAETYSDLSADYLQEANLLNNAIMYNLDKEISNIEDADRAFEEVYILSLEWMQILDPASNISVEEIKIQNITHLTRIQTALFHAGTKLNDTLTHQIYYHFEIMKEDTPFPIEEEDINGVNYNISKELWDASNTRDIEKTYSVVNATNFLNNDLVDAGFTPGTDILERILSDSPVIYFLVHLWNVNFMLQEPYFLLQERASQVEKQSNQAQSIINKVSLGVSVTTIAAVLSTSMSARLIDKKNEQRLKQIRADVLDNQGMVSSRIDMIAITVLIAAMIISLIGLIFVFI